MFFWCKGGPYGFLFYFTKKAIRLQVLRMALWRS